MPHTTFPSSLLSLMAALAENNAFDSVLTIEVRDDETVEQAVERGLREHREVCPDCQAAHEKAKSEKPADTRYEGKNPNLATPYGDETGKAPYVRQPIGYMAFAKHAGEMKAIPGSFDEDRAAVEAVHAKMKNHPLAQLLDALGAGRVEIRPVYGE